MISTLPKLRLAVICTLVAFSSAVTFAEGRIRPAATPSDGGFMNSLAIKGPGVPMPIPPGGGDFAKGPGVPMPIPPGGGDFAKGPGVPMPIPPGGGDFAKGPGVPMPIPPGGGDFV